MISIWLGLPGSGKSACAVRYMLSKAKRTTFSNIIMNTKDKMFHELKMDMLVKKELLKTKKDGTPVYEYKSNEEFWKKARKKYGPMNVVLDEAHIIMDSRKSQSKVNKIMNDTLAVIRRVLGSKDSHSGEMMLITQLDRRIDVIAREMATSVRYHVCHYVLKCSECKSKFPENSETPEKLLSCPCCGSTKLNKCNFNIEVWHYRNMDAYDMWKEYGMRTHHMHYFVRDIEKYFPMYDTEQWENMLSSLY